jgi:hypothetical protein
MSASLPEVRRLLRLKAQRLDAARSAHAAAVAAVRAAEDQLARRDAAVAAIDVHRIAIAAWFGAPASDPRLIEAALARRDLLDAQRAGEEAARVADVQALAEAEAYRAATARALAEAQARHDATAQVRDRLQGALTRRRELRQELEFEERLVRAGGQA